MFAGKPVTKVKAGKYTLKVVDQSKKASLIIPALGYRAMTYSTPSATGTTTHSLTLFLGKYFFRSSPSGAKTYFTVSR
jgi:hypothetical protein